MKDEIKEILEALKIDEDDLNLRSSMYPLQLTIKEQKILLDYITNLQEEKEKYKTAYENVMIANKMLDEKYNDYKTRIDKAVDKIQNMIESNKAALSNPEHTIVAKHKLLKSDNDDCEYLLNILQGSDE